MPSYPILRSVLRLLASMPLPLLHGMGYVLGNLVYLLPTRVRRTTQKNLQVCFPEWSKAQRGRLARESLVHTACTALEMGKAWLWPVERTVALTREWEGYEGFQAAFRRGKGMILLAPHLSNWEIFGFFATNGLPSNFMYQPPRSAATDRLLKEGRTRSGVKMAPTSRRGVAQVLDALQRGELVGVLPDQVPPDGSGEFVPFFNEPAYTMTLVSRLASRTGAAVYCGFAMRLPRGKGFRAIFRPVDEAIYDPDLKHSLLALNQAVEEVVAMAPAQYQWEYKRFRRRPDNREFY